MISIEGIVNNFNEIIATNNKDTIIRTIKEYHPIIGLFLISSVKVKEYLKYITYNLLDFDDECVNYLIKINNYNMGDDENKELDIDDRNSIHHDDDINFIIANISMGYVSRNDINNINNIYNNFKYCAFEILYQMILANNFELLDTFIIMNFYNNQNDGLEDIDIFNDALCKYSMRETNSLEMIRIFHNYYQAYPDKMNFDITIVLNCALVNGKEICMHYALNNGAEYFVDVNQFNNDEIIDTLIYAIIGKNLNCVRTICDVYLNEFIQDCNWERYILFASTFGTIDIVKYLLNLQPHLVEQIENLYNKILKYALINVNNDCVLFALNNGAIYNDNMLEFVHEYNTLYNRCIDNPDYLDTYDFYIVFRLLPDNYEHELQKCIDFVKYRLE